MLHNNPPIKLSQYLYGEDQVTTTHKFSCNLWKITVKNNANIGRCVEIEYSTKLDCEYWEYDLDISFGILQYFDIAQEYPKNLTRKITKHVKFTNYTKVYRTVLMDADINAVTVNATVYRTLYNFKEHNLFNSVVPNISDFKLIVEGQTLYVCKKILAQHSVYFYDLFYGEQANENRQEYVITDTTCNSFRLFLGLMYNHESLMTMKTWPKIAELSARFMADECLEICEKFLMEQDILPEAKLKYAQGFKFKILEESVFDNFKTVQSVLSLGHCSYYESFGEETRKAMLNRMLAIDQKETLATYYCFDTDVHTIQGLKFTIVRTHDNSNLAKVTIQCSDFDPGHLFNVRATIKVIDSDFKEQESKKLIFTVENSKHTFVSDRPCIGYHKVMFIINSIVEVFPHRSTSFFEIRPNLTDVVLSVADKKFHVSKQILANSSTYFYTMFYGNFRENGKAEIELKGVNAEKFEEFLQFVYHPTRKITDENARPLLRRASMYDVQFLVRRCGRYLEER